MKHQRKKIIHTQAGPLSAFLYYIKKGMHIKLWAGNMANEHHKPLYYRGTFRNCALGWAPKKPCHLLSLSIILIQAFTVQHGTVKDTITLQAVKVLLFQSYLPKKLIIISQKSVIKLHHIYLRCSLSNIIPTLNFRWGHSINCML